MCYSFSCLFLIFLLVFENHFFSLFSFVLHPSVNTIRRHSSPFEKLLWNACSCFGLQRKRQFSTNSIQWVRVCERMCVRVLLLLLLSFSLFLFRSNSFIHFSFALFHRATPSVCRSVQMCVCLFSTDTLKCACSHHICTIYVEREMWYRQHIFHLCLSLHISIYHTYTDTLACIHSLTHTQSLTDFEFKANEPKCVLCLCNGFFDMHG